MTSLTPLLDSLFNPLILGVFLYGVYLLLFVQAVWKLLKRRAYVAYIFALVLLCMCITSSLIISWVLNRSAFIVNNTSPMAVVATIDAFPILVSFFPVFVANVVSDGILIWRCYVLWNTAWCLIILILLLAASSACNLYFGISQANNHASLLLGGLNQVLSAATTVCGTLLIALKIILVTRESRARYSYTKVIDILVQSAALESLVLMINAISEIAVYIIVESNSNNVSLYAAFVEILAYTSSLRIVVTGIAPTLIAFRVAEERPRTEVNGTSQSSPLSRLAFKRSAGDADTNDGSCGKRISTIRFGSAQRDDSVISAHYTSGLDEVQVVAREKRI